MFMLKNRQFVTVAEGYSFSDVSTILFTDKKTFTVATPKNLKNHQLCATAAAKKKDVAIKRLRTRSTFRQSTDGTSRQVTSGRQIIY